VSKLKRLLCYESQHQSQSNEKSLVQFDYEKAVSNYLGTQSTFNPHLRLSRSVSRGAEASAHRAQPIEKLGGGGGVDVFYSKGREEGDLSIYTYIHIDLYLHRFI